MGTHFYHVKVVACANADVTFGLRIITGERSRFGSDESFALMLMYDPIYKNLVKDAPLGREMTLDHTADSAWLDRHVNDYVAATTLTDVKNLPVTADLEAMTPNQYRAFLKSRRAPSATLQVTATRAEWVQHLRVGMEWDSAAYDALQ